MKEPQNPTSEQLEAYINKLVFLSGRRELDEKEKTLLDKLVQLIKQ